MVLVEPGVFFLERDRLSYYLSAVIPQLDSVPRKEACCESYPTGHSANKSRQKR